MGMCWHFCNTKILTRAAFENGVRANAALGGWTRLYREHVTQTDEELDLDSLRGGSGATLAPQAF